MQLANYIQYIGKMESRQMAQNIGAVLRGKYHLERRD